MRRVLILLFTVFYVVPTFPQAKHPFTFEDMMSLKRIGEPVPSPDGKWVLFSAVDVDLASNKKTPHIWIVRLAAPNAAGRATGVPPVGARERVLIPDQDGDRPRWAPDGKRFAFTSTKEGGSQVWIADFDSAAGSVTGLHKLTAIATEANGEIWSPDGKNILFTSDVYPECDGAPGPEQECNAKKLEEHEKSKVKALIFDRLLYRHWNAYKEGKRTHLFVVPDVLASARSGQPGSGIGPPPPRDLTPGDYDSPIFSLGGQDNYAFSPDGQEVCYTSNHDKVEATSTNNDLWIVPVNGGAPKNITADNPASDSTPLYSPDGKYVAYRAQQRPGYESDRFRLMFYDRKTGERKNISDQYELDLWAGTFTWTPDSKKLYFAAERSGESPILVERLDPFGIPFPNIVGDWPPATERDKNTPLISGFNDDLTLTRDGKWLLFTRMSISAPNEIYIAPSEPGECKKVGAKVPGEGVMAATTCVLPKALPLTHINDSVLSQVAMSPLESFWFEGAKGDKVQGFLVKPPNFDANKKYPVKFLIHGGPQGAWGDDWSYRWNPELFAANGYVVIMINFHGSTGYGQKFIDAINGDWGGAPYEDLMNGLDYAEKTYPFIDKDRECAMGASYGGYATNWILGHTTRFKCIVTHDGMFNSTSAWGSTEELWFNEWEFKGTPYTNRAMYDKWSPHMYATNFKTPTLVVHGQLDYRLDVSEGFQLFTTLQRQNIPSKMLYFPDEGHWVLKPQNSQLWYKTVNEWVDQWTKR
jgi:dipeptidyl aminopeptidase/acylaminoacyl peptidase